MGWSVLLPILEAIWATVSPLLKPMEIAELESLKTQYANNPLILAVLSKVEAAISAT